MLARCLSVANLVWTGKRRSGWCGFAVLRCGVPAGGCLLLLTWHRHRRRQQTISSVLQRTLTVLSGGVAWLVGLILVLSCSLSPSTCSGLWCGTYSFSLISCDLGEYSFFITCLRFLALWMAVRALPAAERRCWWFSDMGSTWSAITLCALLICFACCLVPVWTRSAYGWFRRRHAPPYLDAGWCV